MVQEASGFRVYSDLNPFIDFMIVLDMYEDFNKAGEVIKSAEKAYWADEDAESASMTDWIGSKLEENGISFEIF